jgi:hypothetical protein
MFNLAKSINSIISPGNSLSEWNIVNDQVSKGFFLFSVNNTFVYILNASVG